MKYLNQEQNSYLKHTRKSIKKNFSLVHQENAITLIALVITIIVLLILAGISINLISGNHGILQKASHSVNQTEISSAKENTELLIATYASDYYDKKYTR